MTIATDVASYGLATARIVASTTSQVITGTAGLLGAAFPGNVNQVVLVPSNTGVYWNVGTASTSSASIPLGGIAIKRNPASMQAIEIYAGSAIALDITLAAPSAEILRGPSLALDGLEINLGNVGLLNAAEDEIDPAESQPANDAYTALDKVTPAGAVRKDTMALPEAIADGDWGALQTDSVGVLRTAEKVLETPVAKAWASGSQITSTTPAAIAIVATETFATQALLQAKRVGGTNSTNVHIGFSTTLIAGTAEVLELAPDETFEMVARAGAKFDMNTIHIDTDTGADGVTFIYETA